MSDGLLTLFGAVGAVGTMLAVLLPVIRAQGASLRREIEAQGTGLRREIEAQGIGLRGEIEAQGTGLRREIDSLRIDVQELRRDVHALSDRVARVEGALSGPWRPPANGRPAAPAPDAEAEDA